MAASPPRLHAGAPTRRCAALALALTFALSIALATAGCHPSTVEAKGPVGGAAITGAGGTFPAPLYTRWAVDYRAKTGDWVNYQAIGSGGGIDAIRAGQVDFGATDMPLTEAELRQAGLYQFPVVAGGVVPVVNLPGVGPGRLTLSGPVLADIYLGAVTRWNDAKIAALNPGADLPASAITVVHRAKPSGPTFLFTSYLSAVSPRWKARAGAGDTIDWPTGIGAVGDNGVATLVKETSGAVGYVEYAFARRSRLAYTRLRNHDGQVVAPSAAAFAAAMADVDWGKVPGNDLVLVDPPGAASWPITGATYILLHARAPSAPQTRQVVAFFDWAYAHGDPAAVAFDYVPLPPSAKDVVRGQWAATLKDASGRSMYRKP